MKNKTRPFTHISGCEFVGVKFDEKATEAILVVAQALLNLTQIFKASNISIDAMLKVENPKREIK